MKIEFLDILNASISASWMILAVIALRFLLKKAPKAIHCALWALVALRLLCPISIESQFSLIPSAQTVSDYYQTQDAAISTEHAVLDIVENPVYPQDVDVTLELPAHRAEWQIFEWAFVWPAGMAAMAGYALLSWLRLRKKVAASISVGNGLWLCDYIDSPFILGILRPRIYLPSDMEPAAAEHVLAHERAHLARRDHWWKPLGFELLTIHWFNPLMWIAYILLCRNIELACDERVIQHLDAAEKRSYSAALLRCSVSRPMIAACPLAFGEVGVRERVKSVLNYKKPTFWVVVIALILSVVVAVCFLTDPLTPDVYDVLYQEGYTVLAQCGQNVTLTIPSDALPETIYAEGGHEFRERQVTVYEDDTTAIWLRGVMPANETPELLYFEFDFSYDFPRIGTFLCSDWVYVGTTSTHGVVEPLGRSLTDDSGVHADTVSLRAEGPGCRFTFYVDTETVRSAQGEICISVSMNQVTYARQGAEPKLNKASDQNEIIHASEDSAYDMGKTEQDNYVFLEPYKAFDAMMRDYSDAVAAIQAAHDLEPLTPLDYADYKIYGAQSEDEDCRSVARFLDFYENSFSDDVPSKAEPTAESLMPGLYKSQDKLYWALYSSYYLETMTMEVSPGTIKVWDGSPVDVEWNWQDECPIRDALRQLLAELEELDPIFAFDKLLKARYMVIDTTHFLVDHETGLYLVSWRHSTKSVEIINYIFRMVPETDWVPYGQNIHLRDGESDAECMIRSAIFEHNPVSVGSNYYAFASFLPITQAMGDGPEYSTTEFYGPARLMVYESHDGRLRLHYCDTFMVAAQIRDYHDTGPEMTVYWQSNTDELTDLLSSEHRFNSPVVNTGNAEKYALELDLECQRQMAAYFDNDGQTLLNELKQRTLEYEYFDLSTAKGLEVYWREGDTGIECVVTSGTNINKTPEMLESLPKLTTMETMFLLDSYGLDEDMIVYLPF